MISTDMTPSNPAMTMRTRAARCAWARPISGAAGAAELARTDTGELRPARLIAAGGERAAAGDARARAVFAAAGRALGLALANLIALFAPPRIILVGALVEAGPA
ncbi:hypothetical protein J8J27_20835, partial [Mycobacterium tuberculosis]|nr:hypothetical protein [Mycobacterium tuberculosis]